MTSTEPVLPEEPADLELAAMVRDGRASAFAELYARHVRAARHLARRLAHDTAEADDLVSEAFAKVLHTLKAGRGPDSSFRAYLFTALRHTAYDKTRDDRRVEPFEDVTTIVGVDPDAVSVAFVDTAVAGLERGLAARAFASLPERWQAVLRHTEIDGHSPAEVAPILGLTPNGVSALARRAREGLTVAYLHAHLDGDAVSRCATAAQLAAWARGSLSCAKTTQVEAHLDVCGPCAGDASELADTCSALVGERARCRIGPRAVRGARGTRHGLRCLSPRTSATALP